MSDYLKTYKITLKTVGPVFIGRGSEINKKEYIYDENEGKIYIPDFGKMTRFLEEKGLLTEFESFLLRKYEQDGKKNNSNKGNKPLATNDRLNKGVNSTNNRKNNNYKNNAENKKLNIGNRTFNGTSYNSANKQRNDNNSGFYLNQWLESHGISIEMRKSWVSYSVDCKGLDLKNKPLKTLQMFIKDAYGCPYIPGSSLKGALRTAFEAADILQNGSKYVDVSSNLLDKRNADYSKIDGDLSYLSFGDLSKDQAASNDCMRGIIVSDSEPLNTDQLIICQKIDFNIKGKTNLLPLIRECLKPGTEVTFDLTVDPEIAKISPEDILSCVNIFFNHNKENFDKHFKNRYLQCENPIYIGGGAGFQTKTVLSPLFSLVPEKQGEWLQRTGDIIGHSLAKDQKSLHANEKKYHRSPHVIKRTLYNGKEYPFGLCSLKIDPT